jgi:hypothetical protein
MDAKPRRDILRQLTRIHLGKALLDESIALSRSNGISRSGYMLPYGLKLALSDYWSIH